MLSEGFEYGTVFSLLLFIFLRLARSDWSIAKM